MNVQTKKPALKNAPFAILTVGGGIQAIVMGKDGKAEIAQAQAVKLDDVADMAKAVKDETPAYTIIRHEHELATLARLTGYNLKQAFEQFGAYCHAEKHNYKYLPNAVVHTFTDTAPVFEVTAKDGQKRYYQKGRRIPSYRFITFCCNDTIYRQELAEQTKQAYAQPNKGSKKQVSRSAFIGMANAVLTAGYCQLQVLLRPLSPQVYNANIHGWQADGYQISPNFAITTGYAMIGTYTIPPYLALIAEHKAMTFNARLDLSHTEHMEKLAGIMADLIADTLTYHQCHHQ